MSKFIIDSMLPKYHQQYHHQLLNPVISSSSTTDTTVNYSSTATNNSSSSSSSPPPSLVSSASRMYPYVAGLAAFAGATGAFSSPGTAALAAVVDAASDKSCRYTSPGAPDSMVNYSLHHQNGAASAAAASSAASASMAAAAQFYQHAAAASAAADPLTSCTSQVANAAAATGQPMPDIPRYPWMSITGKNAVLIAVSAPSACGTNRSLVLPHPIRISMHEPECQSCRLSDTLSM
ncbi:hypothetical protein AAG570_010690 [Ranatra chinensis]|uniref:Abdominal-A n=1 Tax=Ranatra chinensis TaxID=642074 RepID=A0ABD0YNA8_9HEMI